MCAMQVTHLRDSGSFITVAQVPEVFWVERLLLAHLDETTAEGEEEAGPHACLLLRAPPTYKSRTSATI